MPERETPEVLSGMHGASHDLRGLVCEMIGEINGEKAWRAEFECVRFCVEDVLVEIHGDDVVGAEDVTRGGVGIGKQFTALPGRYAA